MKQFYTSLLKLRITDLVFYLVILSIPFQLRTILNLDDSYISYYFSYHKAFFVYFSDILVACLAFICIAKRERIHFSWYMAIPLGIALISAFHVKQFDAWLYGTVKIIEFTFLFAYLRTNPNLKRPAAWIIVISGLAQALLAIGQFHVEQIRTFTIPGYYLPAVDTPGAATIVQGGEKILRAYGTFPHPNVLGGFLALSIGMLGYVSRETHKLKASHISIITGILAWGLLVSFSRSAWLAAAIIVAILLYDVRAYYGLKKGLIVLFSLLAWGAILIGIYGNLVIPRTSESVDKNPAASYRADFNNMSETIVKDNYLFGTGTGQYIRVAINRFHVEPWEYQPPHNIYIYILATTGIIGALILIIGVLSIRFTWNIAFPLLLPILLIIGSLDHYLLTIQQGQFMITLILAYILRDTQVSP